MLLFWYMISKWLKHLDSICLCVCVYFLSHFSEPFTWWIMFVWCLFIAFWKMNTISGGLLLLLLLRMKRIYRFSCHSCFHLAFRYISHSWHHSSEMLLIKRISCVLKNVFFSLSFSLSSRPRIVKCTNSTRLFRLYIHDPIMSPNPKRDERTFIERLISMKFVRYSIRTSHHMQHTLTCHPLRIA